MQLQRQKTIPCSVGALKRKSVDDLKALCVHMGIGNIAIKRGPRPLKQDYVAALEPYCLYPRPFSLPPLPPLPVQAPLSKYLWDMTPEEQNQISLEQALDHISNLRAVNYIPMTKFTPLERSALIRRSPSMTILAKIPPNEVEPWLDRWPLALKFIPIEMQTQLQCQKCFQITPWALEYCNPAYITPDMEEKAVQEVPMAISWLRQRTIPERYEYLCQLAVKADPWTIEYIPNPSPALRSLVLEKDWYMVRFLSLPLTEQEQALVDLGKRQEEIKKAQYAEQLKANAIVILDPRDQVIVID